MRSATRATVALGLLATGCGGTDSSGTSGGDTVTIGITADPGNLSPLTSLSSTTSMINRFSYDGLVNVEPDGRIVSGVAEKWTSDALTASFTLRGDVTCGNGRPLAASDVAAQYNYVADPKNGSPLYGLAVAPGTVATADDATRTLTLTTPEPAPFLLRGASALPLVCPTGFAAPDTLTHGSDGTGPYRLTETVPGDRFTYTKRPDYAWGPNGVGAAEMPERVVFKVVGNESTRANLLLDKQLDIAPVPGADRARLTAAGLKHEVQRDPFGMFLFNEAPNHVTIDPQVRWALVAALDLKQLGAVATGGKGAPPARVATVQLPPCQADAVTANTPPHDKARAAAALRAAGWEKSGGRWTKDGKQLSIVLPHPTTSSQLVSAVELAVEQWKSFGVKVTRRPLTNSTTGEVLASGEWDVAWVPVALTQPDQIVPFFSGPKAPEGLNFGSVDNPEYQRLVGLATAKPDLSGCPEWTAAEAELIKRVDVATFVDSLTPYFTRGAKFVIDGSGILPTSLRRG
ncbi:ABC transporter substrate-binding protein [Streptomyces sp. SID3343]|uniref:ABC transporter substrate-binding protein n=1 Tax=Streptomyces sp. SID3343 TaxID=2690260 RepID=UPI00136A0DA2|nr:ABC transporter substrate-binding protein [Streptomyces sp. SID3343]MYW04536.1 ABC transporter substrate-binding protein [Streptomyces sp. SID3343]